jgi:acetyl-CoA acyltransferase
VSLGTTGVVNPTQMLRFRPYEHPIEMRWHGSRATDHESPVTDHQSPMKEAVIASSVRTPVGKAFKGTLRSTRPDDLAAVAMQEAIRRVPGLDPKEIEDVILGCAMPEAEQGMNVARNAALRAGLPVEISAITINRFCSSGLQSIAMAAERIMAGYGDVILAGGTESMTMIPMGGNKVSPNPWLMDHNPDAYLSMGLTAENVARKYGITREEADGFSLASHKKALAAIAAGKFKDEIVPVEVKTTMVANGANGSPNTLTASGHAAKAKTTTTLFEMDEGPRADTSLEALAKLKPAFHARGTTTAGNSSQMSDGAAATIVMSGERARALGVKPMARFLGFATAGVPPEIMGIGPAFAIPKVLKLTGLTLDQIEVIELNEAFAVQSLAVIKMLGIDPARVNPNGGAIALGHPLGCTGAKLTASILRELERRNARYGMVTMCIGGGMGAAGIFERIA